MKYSEYQEEFTRERIDLVVAGLRRIADDVERDRDNKNLAFAVSNTIHAIMWGVANLGLSTLQDNLTRYQESRQQELEDRITELEQ